MPLNAWPEGSPENLHAIRRTSAERRVQPPKVEPVSVQRAESESTRQLELAMQEPERWDGMS